MLTGTLRSGARVARWWFTDRLGGFSAPPYDSLNLAAHVGDEPTDVRANRAALETELGAGPLSWMGPVHGTDIVFLDAPTSITPDVDALATTTPGTPLVTLGADCVPVLIAVETYVIAAHIGWRGFAADMSASIRTFLMQRGVDVADAKVLLGPAICGSCYAIPDERADAIAQVSRSAVVRLAAGRAGADIRVGLAEQWAAYGASVEHVGPCTFEDRRYFSHRRDGVTGRQAGVIAWV